MGGGRLTAAELPDDYQAIVATLTGCVAAEHAATQGQASTTGKRECVFIQCEEDNLELLRSFGAGLVGDYDHAKRGIVAEVDGDVRVDLAAFPADFKIAESADGSQPSIASRDTILHVLAGVLGDVRAMVAAADRREVWVPNAATRMRMEMADKVFALENSCKKVAPSRSEGVSHERELLDALVNLQKQIHEHYKMNVRKDYSLMVADAQASKAIANASAVSRADQTVEFE